MPPNNEKEPNEVAPHKTNNEMEENKDEYD